MDDAALPFRSMYASRMFSTSPLIPPPPPPPPPPSYVYPSPPQLLSIPSQYPAAPPPNDYVVGHVLTNSCYPNGSYYTCIGAPVGHGLPNSGGSSREGGGGGDVRDLNQEGLNWGRRQKRQYFNNIWIQIEQSVSRWILHFFCFLCVFFVGFILLSESESSVNAGDTPLELKEKEQSEDTDKCGLQGEKFWFFSTGL